VVACGYHPSSSFGKRINAWQCNIAADCYPKPCQRFAAIEVASHQAVNDLASDFTIPIAAPGAIPAAMVMDLFSQAVLITAFGNAEWSAMHNDLFACGYETDMRIREAKIRINKSTKPSLSISFGKSLVFPKSMETAQKASEYWDLAAAGVDAYTGGLNNYGHSSEKAFRFPGINGKLKSSLTPTLNGSVSLTISPFN